MAASTNNKFIKTGASTVTTLSAPGKALSATSITVGSTTNYPIDTGIVFAIRQVDVNGDLVAGTYTEWIGTVTSATTLSLLATPVYGSDQVYPAGSTTQVFIPLSAAAHNRLIDGILTEHDQDGTHSNVTATSVTADTVTAGEFILTGSGSNKGWEVGLPTPDTITYNGNRSYDLVFNSTDLTDTISPGMRIRTARTVAAPIQCATFDGTNDYFSKSSPTGMTFTDDFVVSAWVKLSSYPAVAGEIVSRYNGTSGWHLDVDSSGRVRLIGYNGGVSNPSYVMSYQSIPLNKWVHVTAQLDMSAFTATSTTSYIMLDGIDVPAQVLRGGTNPTALVQAGNLEIGSYNGGLLPFTGKIAQVAIYSAKVTQATIKASMNQGLTGGETSLVSAYSLSNSLEDLSANNNDLTANGGVLTTTADSPFGNSGVSTTLDYGIVQKAVFSTNTTLTVQVPEGCTIPTSGGISSVDYSTQAVPYGFPRDKGRWSIYSLLMSSTLFTATSNTWYNPSGFGIHAPVGSWDITFNAIIRGGFSSAGGSFTQIYAGFSTTSAVSPYTTGHSISTSSVSIDAGVGPSLVTNSTTNNMSIESTTLTVYYLNFMINTGGTTYANQSGIYCNTLVPAKIILEPSLL